MSDLESPLVTLTGEVDSTGSERVNDVLEKLLAYGCASPRVDLAGVSYMDTTGLLALVRWAAQFRASDGALEVVSVNPLVRRLFDLAGRSDIIVQSEERSLPPQRDRQPITDCFAAAPDWEIRSFSVAARLESCKVVRDRIARMAANVPFSEQEQTDLKMAVGEAIANAIRHGCSEKADEAVTIRCLGTRRWLIVEISDPGLGFDPSLFADPVEGSVLEGRMGIHCMRRCVDEVTFDFSAGTTARLVKVVRPAAL